MEGGLHHPREEQTNKITGKSAWIPREPEKNFTLFDEQSDRLRLMWGRYQLPRPTTGRSPGLLLKHEADNLHREDEPGQ
mgnify:CR=1 FL=1